jgi:preprotein translocase subunit SecE
VDKKYLEIGIWAGVIGAVFAVLWFTGNLVKLRNYIAETREELKKCTWPTNDELKGSTVVVMISVLLLGAFTVVVDNVLFLFVNWMVKL